MNYPVATAWMIATMAAGGSLLPGPWGRAGTPVQAPGCVSPGQRVHEERFVPIGGIEQWMTITGDRCANPVVLVLHGGPGNTLSPYADALFDGWHEHFTVVQWDHAARAARTAGIRRRRDPG